MMKFRFSSLEVVSVALMLALAMPYAAFADGHEDDGYDEATGRLEADYSVLTRSMTAALRNSSSTFGFEAATDRDGTRNTTAR